MTKKIPFLPDINLRRVRALVIKEMYQIVRDPSSILIAFVFPLMLMFLFGYGVSLDPKHARIGVVMEDPSADVEDFIASFQQSPYFEIVRVDTSRHKAAESIMSEAVDVLIIGPSNYEMRSASGKSPAPIQIITDGSKPNTSGLLSNYIQAAWQIWLDQRMRARGEELTPPVQIQARVWYNPASISRYFLLPGSIALIMTIIGTLLTALVVAREWERGTMEALMSTPITIFEIIIGKLIPYFFLGLCSMSVCVFLSIYIFDVPFRGSLILLLLVTSIFLYAALSLGLLISTAARNQYVASQMALYTAYLPAFMLSGFIFEISGMPAILRLVSSLLPARYLVSILQTIFLAGDLPRLILVDCVGIFAIGTVFVIFLIKMTRKRID
ncbi:MAG: hypothetical protein C0514_06915 [Candidatus Puniceispirillum sp.]|nr:hypothetical protein [Candidatus Puniceispirillum sp.]